MTTIVKQYINYYTDSSPLAVFRIGFGLMMLFSIIRFWSKGWIEKIYIEPSFHFTYYGFEWVKPLGDKIYILFILCAISSALIAIGLKYKLAIITFFLSFTYIELLEKTIYLNHYYFICVLSFLLIFLPLNSSFSIDNLINNKKSNSVPRWTIDSIKLMLGIVYIYAGLAKINSDWLLQALPLKIWLPSKYDLPIIGETLMQENWVHFAMSWGGMLYDLLIPFLLLYKRTRTFAFLLVVFFHVFTRVLFPIGVFPYIMIISALIFFDAKFHKKIINILKKIINPISKRLSQINIQNVKFYSNKKIIWVLAIFFILQLTIPLRHLSYNGNIMWHEQGYRFSWRVMLMEKLGYTTFKILDNDKNQFFYVQNEEFLTSYQEKQMSFQPDFILEYAHFLGKHFKSKGFENIEVFAESYVSLNGRRSQMYIDPEINLLNIKDSFKNKYWILPLK
tara:strand:+ start:502 stop:1848 length:1347 start_codon:yes stop_codon:yes gene_type:complete